VNNRVVVFLVLAFVFLAAFAVVGNLPVSGAEPLTAFRAGDAGDFLLVEQADYGRDEDRVTYVLGSVNNLVAITWSLFALGVAAAIVSIFARTKSPVPSPAPTY